MSIQVEARVLNTEKKHQTFMDAKTGQKVEKDVIIVRCICGKDIGAFQTDDAKALDLKDGATFKFTIRKLEEKAGFFRVFGDLVAK